jgi:predicted ATPase/transcriptional regulator with XRE-family HTH domain
MAETISFGAWLRQQRRALDLTQRAFANRVGCAEITLRRMEADEYKPSQQLALVLFEKLGISELEQAQWVRFARGLAELPTHQVTPSPSREKITNLPIPLTSFIGRAKDVALIQQRLAGHRLVTLIGAGGIGKTRLSQQVASQLLEEYSHGVWLVELASVSDPALVPQTAAAVFAIQQDSEHTLIEMLIRVLRPKTALLIFDNCEHLLDACAGLADNLLKNCPNLKILATSREALGIIGEAHYPVPSLTIPDIQQISFIQNLNDYESIRLFEERAQLVQMDFTLTKENASSVAQICSHLDGIPLAIELAAVRVQTLSVEQIAEQLDQCFLILTSGSRTALPKHQTLQASIDWSWHLLCDSEQTLLRRLSVFAGAFTMEAVSQVCTGDGIESLQAVGLISQLVQKSLVVENQESGRERRYRLLETIRQYAHERLVESGEEENIRTQHLKYYLQLSEQAEPGLKGPAQMEWYARLNDERDNLRAALAWAEKTAVEAGLSIAGRLWRFWEVFDLREGDGWLGKFLAKPNSQNQSRARAQALYAHGIILYLTEQYALLEKAGQECLAIYRALGDQHGEIDALIVSARFRFATNDWASMMEFLHQALALSESLGDTWREAFVIGHLGWGTTDDYAQRISYFKEAVSLFRKAGDLGELGDYLGALGNFEVLGGNISSAQEHLNEALQLNKSLNRKGDVGAYFSGLSRIESINGNFEKARALLEESIAWALERGHRNDYQWDRAHLGHLIVRQGQAAEAREIFLETARGFLKDGNIIGVVYSLEGTAGLYVATDKPTIAARLIGFADATRKEISDPRPLLEQRDVDQIIAACLAKMNEVAFSDAHEEGQKMTLDQAVAYALQEN